MWHEHNKLLSSKIIGTSQPRPAAESDDLPGGDLFDIIKQHGAKGIIVYLFIEPIFFQNSWR